MFEYVFRCKECQHSKKGQSPVKLLPGSPAKLNCVQQRPEKCIYIVIQEAGAGVQATQEQAAAKVPPPLPPPVDYHRTVSPERGGPVIAPLSGQEVQLQNEIFQQTGAVGFIVVHDENAASQTHPLRIGPNVIGRKSSVPTADILIDTVDGMMSRRHVILEVTRDKYGQFQYLIAEAGSKNGTFVIGAKDPMRKLKLEPEDLIYLEDGDTIQMGRTKVVLQTTRSASNARDAARNVQNTDYSKTIIW
ncbi:FHA domain-containing protein [Runella zeae]|jgi:pSer/pThr/pTyr-binding forkhead associated (FHA) protein|uniref:FHA domain-containing protein n=1 Tax=Runella zeae TaxID=94255 RepID=UPI000685D7D8|nr:FHA domain-containing protein [Runella zeae]